MKKIGFYLIFLLYATCSKNEKVDKLRIDSEMEVALKNGILETWYPRAIDSVHGGFLTSFTYDFKATADQDKMIVTQARHTWTNARASMLFPDMRQYRENARHGFEFLKNVMWDHVDGGFFQLVDREGHVKNKDYNKTAYGNAFGIFALAAYYKSSGDTSGLNLAKKAFMWLEHHSHDPLARGYFQHLERNGNPIARLPDTPSASDTGYKDQNSSIHLLEAFTELYQVWPDPLLRDRLTEMLVLIRGTITNPKGYLILFLQPDWTPVSFADSSEAVIQKHHFLDHVSFGHDVETAYLMREASEVLGLKKDSTTELISKRMVDHALRNGWDSIAGGFYDEGYYFKDKPGITITRDTKNWWAQAEGLNSLLMMSEAYPDDKMQYFRKFELLWKYAQTNLIDHQHGDWYPGGLDKQPEMKTALKGQIWKANYHQFRSLENCIRRLRDERTENR